MTKYVLKIYQFFSNLDSSISGAQLSPVISVPFVDNIGIELTWPMTATGTIAVNASIDGATFQPLPGLTPTSPSGSNTGTLINLNQFPFPYLQISFTKSGSSTGLINGWISGKAI
jgi:hypothetical protein